MRMQSAIEKSRRERDAIVKQKRERAVSLLRNGTKRSDVVKRTGVARTTIDRLYNALHQSDTKKLDALLSPELNRRGRRPVISPQESGLIEKDRLRC